MRQTRVSHDDTNISSPLQSFTRKFFKSPNKALTYTCPPNKCHTLATNRLTRTIHQVILQQKPRTTKSKSQRADLSDDASRSTSKRISGESRGSNGVPPRSFRLFSSARRFSFFCPASLDIFPIRVRLDVKISARSVYFRRDGVSGKM